LGKQAERRDLPEVTQEIGGPSLVVPHAFLVFLLLLSFHSLFALFYIVLFSVAQAVLELMILPPQPVIFWAQKNVVLPPPVARKA
jgi:hypothetical protein